MRLPSVGFTRRSRSNQSRAPLAFRRNRLNLRRAQRNVVGHRRLDDSFSDFKTGPAISPISWFDAKQPRPREWGGEAHERNEMECCRRAGDRSFSLWLSVRDSAPSGPGHRGDLPDTFGQLSYLKLTSSKFHLLLPRIGDRHSGRHLGTLSGVGSQVVDLLQISEGSVKSIIMHATVCAVTRHNIRHEIPYKTISYNIFVLFSSCRRVWLTMPVRLHSHTYRVFARIYSGTCGFRAIYAHGAR